MARGTTRNARPGSPRPVVTRRPASKRRPGTRIRDGLAATTADKPVIPTIIHQVRIGQAPAPLPRPIAIIGITFSAPRSVLNIPHRNCKRRPGRSVLASPRKLHGDRPGDQLAQPADPARFAQTDHLPEQNPQSPHLPPTGADRMERSVFVPGVLTAPRLALGPSPCVLASGRAQRWTSTRPRHTNVPARPRHGDGRA